MPTTHNHLICYLGRNGSGKSYRANQLVKDQNYIKVSMADALRELAWKSLGWRPEGEEQYEEFKHSYYQLHGWDCFSGRQYLQNLGQGCKDLFGEDFWVKQWRKTYSEYRNNNQLVVVDDLRFESEIIEADWHDATFLWCDYQKGNYPLEEHVSEALANKILASGKYKDGDEISFEELKTFFN